ncbi:MAG: ABC transporter ATP-binding protein [Roseibium sp.]|uniref:ABC transporter ATP-binding protein n=1 Tax=Roseibium sp. TaxID=1936156 RepID=UPI0026101D23|nr:ABC transporter ATP-binding protein [Roseibium sp.]MCV0424150.1 ABC transporter ATP-binding protein [Roseibium sp.]
MSTLTLDRLSKSFGAVDVLHNISLDITDGEFVVIVGPSGCGKSTLLRTIAGLEPITGGELYLDGRPVRNVPAAKRGLAMVFQSYALYPHKTVEKNMGFALKIAGEPKAEIDRRVLKAARILKLEPLLSRFPRELSGGQRQRVAIGRAIVRDPSIFLFDEPLSNLDAALRAEVRVELRQLHKNLGATMIYVTHDQVEAMTLADKIIVLKDGYLQQVGAPSTLYNDPDNLFVAGFVGSPKMNFIPGCLRQGTFLSKALQTGPFNVDMDCIDMTVGIRPEDISIVEFGKGNARLKVDVAEYLGSQTLVHGRLSDKTQIIAVAPGELKLEADAEIDLDIPTDKCLLFNYEGQRVRPDNGSGKVERDAPSGEKLQQVASC